MNDSISNSKFKSNTFCPICGSNNWQRNLLSEKILSLNSSFNIFRCCKCKLSKLHPYPSDEELKHLYNEEYFTSGEDRVLFGQKVERNIGCYEIVKDDRKEKFQNTIKKLKKIFPNSRKFLDIGAAEGDMTNIAMQFNLDAQGLELSDYCRNKALEKYNIKLIGDELNSLKGDNYDLIHLNHVFEHFVKPRRELNQITRILKKHGGLYIEIPFQFNLVERIKYLFKNRGKFDQHSIHHPYFYNPKNITLLLKQFNLKIIEISIFDKKRYPRNNIKQKIKCFIWFVLSKFNCGNYIEIYAELED